MSILDMNFFSLIGFKKKPKARWAKYYSKKEMNIDVPNISIYQQLKNRSLENNYKDNVALEYFGRKITFGEMFEKIDIIAKGLMELGINKGDIVMMSLPGLKELSHND